MKWIPLTQGLAVKVDDCDFEQLNKYRWSAAIIGNRIYAVRGQTREERGDNPRRLIYMHRQIKKAEPGDRIEHRAGFGFDNSRRNLLRNGKFEIKDLFADVNATHYMKTKE